MGNEFKKIANESGNTFVEVTEASAFVVDTNGTNRITINSDGSGKIAAGVFEGPLTNNGAYIRGRSNHMISFDWTGGLDFWVDTTHVKTFVIDHPTKSDKYLVHGTLEGPEACVFYRGTGVLNKGYTEIVLPDYFEALTNTEGRTIMLTAINGFDKIMVEKQGDEKIKNGLFKIKSENPYSSQEFDWEVKAVRKDVQPLVVEPKKTDSILKGEGPYTYLQKKQKNRRKNDC